MSDITSTHLEAAIIDQVVAGMFKDKPYAFVAVVCAAGWQLGVAVANEAGFNPLGKYFKEQKEAGDWAKGLNDHIRLSIEDVTSIILSTMGGQAYNKDEE